jgi:MFS family permease
MDDPPAVTTADPRPPGDGEPAAAGTAGGAGDAGGVSGAGDNGAGDDGAGGGGAGGGGGGGGTDLARESVWGPRYRRLTVGMLLTVTLVAFESMAISTVMPRVSDDLGGLGLYGWVFSGFFLGSLLGIVVAGQLTDTRGARWPFATALVLFAGGLVAGGAAPSMAVLVVCRVVQGIGAGGVSAIAVASVGRAYPPAVRPRMFAVFSTAWVVPGLVGPVAASSLTELLTWRSVFWGLLPFVVVAAVMTAPVLERTARRTAHAVAGAAVSDGAGPVGGAAVSDGAGPVGGAPGRRSRGGDALVLVTGVGLVLGGSGAPSPVVGGALVVAGLGPAVWAFVRLVPRGTVRLRQGMPAAVAVRGLQTFAFFGTSAFVSLALTEARDGSTWLASVALTASTVSWTAGSWLQQRVVLVRGPRWLVQRGLGLVAAGVVGMVAGLHAPVGVAIPLWALAGLGMGLSYSPLSVTVLAEAEPGREGSASASLQLCDVLGQSLGTGLAGVFVALGEARDWATTTSLDLAFGLTLAVALAGALAATRLPRRLH